jgi:hypothetical protein
MKMVSWHMGVSGQGEVTVVAHRFAPGGAQLATILAMVRGKLKAVMGRVKHSGPVQWP